MKNNSATPDRDLSISLIKSHLICAQSLEIMIDRLVGPISSLSHAGELAEIMEEIANIYLNISEKISFHRADETIFIPESQGSVPDETSLSKLNMA